MADVRYGNEKFTATVRELARGQGRIQERLIDAYRVGIGQLRAEEHLPEYLRREFDALVGRMTRNSEPMSVEEAVEIVDAILRIANDVRRLYEEEMRAPARRPR